MHTFQCKFIFIYNIGSYHYFQWRNFSFRAKFFTLFIKRLLQSWKLPDTTSVDYWINRYLFLGVGNPTRDSADLTHSLLTITYWISRLFPKHVQAQIMFFNNLLYYSITNKNEWITKKRILHNCNGAVVRRIWAYGAIAHAVLFVIAARMFTKSLTSIETIRNEIVILRLHFSSVFNGYRRRIS